MSSELTPLPKRLTNLGGEGKQCSGESDLDLGVGGGVGIDDKCSTTKAVEAVESVEAVMDPEA